MTLTPQKIVEWLRDPAVRLRRDLGGVYDHLGREDDTLNRAATLIESGAVMAEYLRDAPHDTHCSSPPTCDCGLNAARDAGRKYQ